MAAAIAATLMTVFLCACSGSAPETGTAAATGTAQEPEPQPTETPQPEPAEAPEPQPAPAQVQEPEPAQAPETLTAELMRVVKRDLKRGDAAALRPRVAERATIVIDIIEDHCDGTAAECTRHTVVRGYDAFASWLAAARPTWAPANCREGAPPARLELCEYLAGFYIQGRMVCDERCCRLTNDYPGTSMLSLESICFEPTASGSLRIVSITMLEV